MRAGLSSAAQTLCASAGDGRVAPCASASVLRAASVTAAPPALRFAPRERAVLGVVQIATDIVLEMEGAQLLVNFPGVNIRFAKIAFDSEDICAATYEAALASGAIATAGRSLCLPKDYVTVWGVACTSLSFLLGRDRLAAELPLGDKPLVTMWDAVCAALNALGAKRLVVLTPYINEVHDRNIELLEREGFEVLASMALGLSTDMQTSSVEPGSISDCAVAALSAAADADTSADAVFIGCSAFRACQPGFISELELRLGLPVVTSTQAFLWLTLRVGGISEGIKGYGRLFEGEL